MKTQENATSKVLATDKTDHQWVPRSQGNSHLLLTNRVMGPSWIVKMENSPRE